MKNHKEVSRWKFFIFCRNSLRNLKEIFLGIPRNFKFFWEKFTFSCGSSEWCEVWTSNLVHVIFRTFPISNSKILSKSVDLVTLWTLEKLSSAIQKKVVVTLITSFKVNDNTLSEKQKIEIRRRIFKKTFLFFSQNSPANFHFFLISKGESLQILEVKKVC